jgi:uncharacterized protein involved in exopolysaccharide biosynthesis
MVAAVAVFATLQAILAWPRTFSSEARLRVEFRDASAASAPRDSAVHLLVEQLQRQAAQGLLEKRARIWSPPASDLILVQGRSSSAPAAQRLASRMVELCLVESAKFAVPDKSRQQVERSDADGEQAHAAWKSAAARLEEERRKLDGDSMESRRQRLRDEIADADSQLRAIRSDLEATEARAARLEQLIRAQQETAAADRPAPPRPADSAPATLAELEAREQELAATRSDQHPLLVAIRRQVADLRQALAASPRRQSQVPQSAPPGPSATNPSQRALEQSLLDEQSQAATLRSRRAELTASAGRLRAELEQWDGRKKLLVRLEQEVEQAQRHYQACLDRTDLARRDIPPQPPQIARLSVVQAATLPTAPDGPRAAHVLLAGTALAVASGLGSAWLAARSRPILTCTPELARVWDLPLVGIVPRTGLAGAAAS